MTYRWALSGVLERPIFIPEDRFVFPIPRNGKEDPGRIKLSRLTHVYQKAAFLDGLIIVSGQSAERSLAIAVYDGDRQIASVASSLAHTIPEYRGRGIMPEMMAEFFIYDPSWMIFRSETGIQLVYSESAEIALRKAYRLMVQRGAVVPSEGDNSWHKANSPFLCRKSA